jgi:hypothetical protein
MDMNFNLCRLTEGDKMRILKTVRFSYIRKAPEQRHYLAVEFMPEGAETDGSEDFYAPRCMRLRASFVTCRMPFPDVKTGAGTPFGLYLCTDQLLAG